MRLIRKYAFLLLILSLALILRFWHLDLAPPSANWDEASIGYNVYSVAQTGKDEFGNKLPLVFRSLNDYKPPLYIYTDAIFVKFLGLSTFTVRLPAAIFGVLSVLFTYLLIRKLTQREDVALLSSLFLAISPWSLQFSRSAVESGFALFFIIASAYFFLKGFEKGWFAVLSGIFFGLSLFAYQSPRIFVPLLIIILILANIKSLLKNKKTLLLFLITFAVFFLPLIHFLTIPENQARFKGVSIYENPDPFDNVANLPRRYLQKVTDDDGSVVSKVIHNRRLAIFLVLTRGYLEHFKISYLFLPGSGNNIYDTPEVGQELLVTLPLFLIGIYFLIRYKPPGYQLIILWFLAAPIVAAPTIQIPSPVRAQNMQPMLEVIIAFGAIYLLTLLGKTKYKNIFTYAFCAIMALNFFYYLHMYYVHMPLEKSKDWQYGWQDTMSYIQKYPDKKVIIYPELQTVLDKSQAFVLFYDKYDPESYLREGGTKLCQYGMPARYSFGRYEMRTVDCGEGLPKLNYTENIPSDALIVAKPDAYGQFYGLKPVKTAYHLDGTPAIEVYDSNSVKSYLKQ